MRAGDVVPDQPQPRRRITDRDRRRWSDERLDDLRDATERRFDRLEHFERLFRDSIGLMQGVQEQLEETQQDVRELRRRVDTNFDRNFREHREVQATASQIAQTVAPTRWSKVKDFATFISVLIVPFLLTYLTIVLARGGTP